MTSDTPRLVGKHTPPEPNQAFDWSAVPGALKPETEQPPDSVQELESKLVRRLAAEGILKILLKKSSPKKCWERAHVLQHVLKLSGLRTQVEIAKMLKVSPPRVSEIRNFVSSALDGKH